MSPLASPEMTSTPIKPQNSKHDSIKVAVRIKPLKPLETPGWTTASSNPNALVLNPPPPGAVTPSNNFIYDNIFPASSSTEQVYSHTARDIVKCVVNGINGTVFAYGQTCSGKTFTMQGDNKNDGIVQFAARDIFETVRSETDRDFLIRVSFLEIYNEQIRDLLNANGKSLPVRDCPKRGVIVVSTEMVVKDVEGMLRVLKEGEKNRVVAGTAANERSSRSHAIFRVMIESRGGREGGVLVSSLNLVDLAGSESVRYTGATGDRQREGGKINQSLLTLSQVITSLSSSKRTHIPFRNSKLTRVLQSSLSGHARMVLIACITPSLQFIEETRSTLQFASRAKLVTTNAETNLVLDDKALIIKLQRKIEEMSKELEQRETKEVEEKMERLKGMILRADFDRGEKRRSQAGGSLKRASSSGAVGEFIPSSEIFQERDLSQSQHSNDDIVLIGSPTTYQKSTPVEGVDIGCLVGDLHTSMDLGTFMRRLSVEEFDDGDETLSSSTTDITPQTVIINRSSEVDILKDALDAKRKQIETLESRCDETDAFVGDMKQQMEKLSKTVTWLTKQSITKEEQIKSLQKENENKFKLLLKDKTELKDTNEFLLSQRKLKNAQDSFFSKMLCWRMPSASIDSSDSSSDSDND